MGEHISGGVASLTDRRLLRLGKRPATRPLSFRFLFGVFMAGICSGLICRTALSDVFGGFPQPAYHAMEPMGLPLLGADPTAAFERSARSTAGETWETRDVDQNGNGVRVNGTVRIGDKREDWQIGFAETKDGWVINRISISDF